ARSYSDHPFIELVDGAGLENALFREHPRHHREHALGEAAKDHGGRPLSHACEARDDEPGRKCERPDRREDDRGRRGEGAIETGGEDHRADEIRTERSRTSSAGWAPAARSAAWASSSKRRIRRSR